MARNSNKRRDLAPIAAARAGYHAQLTKEDDVVLAAAAVAHDHLAAGLGCAEDPHKYHQGQEADSTVHGLPLLGRALRAPATDVVTATPVPWHASRTKEATLLASRSPGSGTDYLKWGETAA